MQWRFLVTRAYDRSGRTRIRHAFVAGRALCSPMTRSLRYAALLASAAGVLTPSAALAWGSEGHEIIADIARAYLTPEAKTKVDALLAADTDTLTAPDMASRATWADDYRRSHPKLSTLVRILSIIVYTR